MTSHASRKNSAPGEVFEIYTMSIYTKPPLSLDRQVDKLRARGLIIDDEDYAAHCLENISYYRLRAYTFPFQENKDVSKDYLFIKEGIRFSEVIEFV
jgi:abortive infection bacteriophage resistance protein